MGFNIGYGAGGRMDFPFWPTKQKPKAKGGRIVVKSNVVEQSYTVKEPMEFFSVNFAASEYDGEDNWSVFVNGIEVIETIYSKNVQEAINFPAIIPLREGDVIKFVFRNLSSKPKEVYYNYLFGVD